MPEKKRKIKVGVSIGDLNGIGIEIIIKTFLDNHMLEFCTLIVFGSSKVFSAHRKALNVNDFSFNVIKSIKDVVPKKANLINCWNEDIEIKFGLSSTVSGKYSLESLKLACEALKKNQIDVLVTAPINKSSIFEHDNNFIGHTEFLQKEFEGTSLMIMVSEIMKIGFVTSHVSLSKVAQLLSTKKIINKLKLLNTSLTQDFGIRNPKIALLGLNPHAGEKGMLGNEENEIIIPAINKARKEDNINVFGPYPADSFFIKDNLPAFDGVLSMYHDQGLIPFKTLSFSDGVNYTAGLNIIRTSPVHGTGYKISGKNLANEQSFRNSVFLACNIFKKRIEFENITAN